MLKRNVIFLISALLCACQQKYADKNDLVQTDSTRIKGNDSAIVKNVGFINTEEYNSSDNADYKRKPFVPEDSIIGIGIITFDGIISACTYVFVLYDENDTAIGNITMNENQVETTFQNKKYQNYYAPPDFNPRYYVPNPFYFSLDFDCIAKDSLYYHVVLDRKTGLTGKVKKSKRLIFETIEEYIASNTINVEFNRISNPLKNTSNINSDIILNQEISDSIVDGEQIRLKGDWMQIKIGEIEKGWIRWRKGNQILVKVSHGC